MKALVFVLLLAGCSTFEPGYYCVDFNGLRCTAWSFGELRQVKR
jgi:hypothetical protein